MAHERHDVSAAQLYSWRRQTLSGELTRAAPTFTRAEVNKASVPATSDAARRVSIELLSGLRLTIDSGVDLQALARILSVLRP